MKTFSIAEVERYILIKAHTLRIWEKRYRMFKVERTESKLRIYSLDDLACLLSVSLLNRHGYKVSAIAELTKDEINKKVLDLHVDTAKKEHQIHLLILYMYSLDVENVDFILDGAVGHWGIDQTVEDIIIPFIERIGLFSYKEHTSVAFHAIVTALRKKIILAIELAKAGQRQTKSVLLFLPKGEYFDLLLLYINYKMKTLGLTVLYLGTDVSRNNFDEFVKTRQPHFAVTYVPAGNKKIIKSIPLYLPKEATAPTFFITSDSQLEEPTFFSENFKLVQYKQITTEILAHG